ncbi:unnamed protein product [Owenia fusiformis]|uniref:Uncharacterized protein n=1 Tax=Owenia fusiformis TaxID=6347 RepID=A0A8S4P059_OWEFU|nr:unnamed protein product [Owenia fusiformis]
MGTRPLRQSSADVDFFDIDSKIYNAMMCQRLSTRPKIKLGIGEVRPGAHEPPCIKETPLITTAQSKHVDEGLNSNTQKQFKKRSLEKRITKSLTPKKFIAFRRTRISPNK